MGRVAGREGGRLGGRWLALAQWAGGTCWWVPSPLPPTPSHADSPTSSARPLPLRPHFTLPFFRFSPCLPLPSAPRPCLPLFTPPPPIYLPAHHASGAPSRHRLHVRRVRNHPFHDIQKPSHSTLLCLCMNTPNMIRDRTREYTFIIN